MIGFMGAGKSTVGRLLASSLGSAFIDVDKIIEHREGRTVAQIFAADGEARWRELEREASLEALESDGGVIAFGGGALEDPAVYAALEWARVVYLRTTFPEVMRRLQGVSDRPMLTRGDAKALYERRRPVYERIAQQTVDTDGVDPAEIARTIMDGLGLAAPAGDHVRVELGTHSYDVAIGEGIVTSFVHEAVKTREARAVAVVTEAGLLAAGEALRSSLEQEGVNAILLTVPGGEAAKTMATATELSESLARSGIHRGDMLAAVGGGMLLDLAGFVASVFNRGVAHVNVPTTLLAQVDAAIGGKTGVNLPSGKNLVGTFHQPVGVVCDLGYLRTLAPEEIRSGMAEVIKYGLIDDPALLRLVEDAGRILSGDLEILRRLVHISVSIKARYVAADEHDRGRRECLNYGHTFGHAMEHLEAGALRHGEAVSLGMMAAAYTASLTGRLDPEALELHRRCLSAVGLPVSARYDLDQLEYFWLRDKKYRDGIRFVLLDGIGHPRPGVSVQREVLAQALRMLAS